MEYRAAVRWPTAMGSWVVDDYLMVGRHQKILDLEKLWRNSRKRHENEELPGLAGTLDREEFPDEQVVSLKCQVGSKYDVEGNEFATVAEGLQYNLEKLYDIAIPPPMRTPPGTGNTVLSELTMPSGSLRTADIQFEVSEPEKEGGGLARVTLTITVPSGGHVEGGS